MKKYEFVCKTDLVTGEEFYFTREDGYFLSQTFNRDKNKAYDLFIKATNKEQLEKYETIETIYSPTE